MVKPSSLLLTQHTVLFSLGMLVLFSLLLLLPEHALASVGSGGSLPYETWLGKLRDSVTGPVAFTLSIVGIVIAGGVLIFGGEINAFFRTLIFIALVIGLLVGAQNMMESFFGKGAELANAAPRLIQVAVAEKTPYLLSY